MIEYGVGGRLRGCCSACSSCCGWSSQATVNRTAARAPVYQPAASPSEPAVPDEEQSRGPEVCGAERVEFLCRHCGCGETAHDDVTPRFGAYAQRGIPLAALRWSQVEFELWRDTGGLFQPSYSEKKVAVAARSQKNPSKSILVSVICPTTASRRCFHPFLWTCWRIQTHTPKELVIVDTCEDEPSEFFMSKMKEDPCIVYRHFKVPERHWSIGLKRNLACYYASGEVIAHFDDDDMYGRPYLETMLKCLCNPKAAFDLAVASLGENKLFQKMLMSLGVLDWAPNGKSLEDALAHNTTQAGLGRFGAACAKLSCWHTYSLRTRSWGVFNACDEHDRELYGWGFSFVYLRASWQECPFAHMGLGEDYDFVRRLMQLGRPVVLVHDTSGLCAHTCHLDNTSGADQEIRRKYGSSSQMYSSVASLLTMFEVSAKGILATQETYRSKQGSLRQTT